MEITIENKIITIELKYHKDNIELKQNYIKTE